MKQPKIPKGWIAAPLEEVVSPRGEKVSPADHPDAHFIGMDHVESHTTKILQTVAAGTFKSNAARFYSGDVLYGRLRPYLNKVALPLFDGLASAEFIVFPETELMTNGFLKHRLNAADFVSFASHLKEGDRPRVGFDQIGKFGILVPPPTEQHRIVAKIEELFSELDNGIENLNTARKQLKVYRQALLQQAFVGKLTAQWREENKDRLETADQLFARIKKEREARYRQQVQEREAAVTDWEANGRNFKKPTKPHKALEPDKPSPEHRRRMWDVPDGWQWLQIGSFAFVTKLAGFEYTKYVCYADDGDLAVIKAENAGPNGYRVTQYSRVHSESVAELSRSHLEGGELLMVFVGVGTGNVATVPTDQRFFLGPNIGMMRLESEAVNPRYVELFLRSPRGKDLALAAVKAVAQPSLSMGTIRQIPVALPSRNEQDKIVGQLGATLSIIDQAESEVAAQISRAETLRQSILKRAFFGLLVAQDPNDEPASVLLERIRAEKAAQGNGKKNNKRKDAA